MSPSIRPRERPPARVGALAAALGALAAAGCRPSVASFPDAGRDRLAFSPDGRTALVAEPARLAAVELPGARPLWEQPLSQPAVGLAFSPTGAFVILVEQTSETRPAALAVLRAADGKRTFAREFQQTSPHEFDILRLLFVKKTARRFALSDDGAFLVAAPDDGRIEVHATATGDIVYREPPAANVDQVVFDAGSPRFAVAIFAPLGTKTVRVVERREGQWAPAATFEDAWHPQWTRTGLFLETRDGVESWSGGARRTVVPRAALPELDDWQASPDGAYLAVWDTGTAASRFAVHRAADGQRLVAEEGPVDRTRAIEAAGFDGPVFRAFVRCGDVVEVNLAGASVVRRVAFGAPASSSPALFTDGVTWSEDYVPLLSPNGRYLDTYREGQGHRLFSTAPPP